MYKHILVPTDGSKVSLKAAREAAKLARASKAKITTLYVIEPFMPQPSAEGYIPDLGELESRYTEATRKIADQALSAVEAAAKLKCEKVSLTSYRPWNGIIDTARKRKCDLIVMGSHGRSGLQKLFLGSETSKVLTHSKTPVLVCR